MSFELFLQAFSAGRPAGIRPATIRAAFGEALTELEEDFWQVSYAQGQSSDLFLAALPEDASLVHTISIYRPSGDARLYEGLWMLLAEPGTCLHYPGGAAPLTRDARLAAALPPGMLGALGAPLVLAAAADILRTLGDDLS